MNIELRADGLHIVGYVNVTEKKSRPVITPRGKVVEMIEERAFEMALERAGNINVTVDHDNSHIYASTDQGTATFYEDSIGLHADVLITDSNMMDIAKQGKIKGWSFGFYNVVDSLDSENRADDYPIRKIKSLDLDHVTLVVNKQPIYSATSIELRANDSTEIEMEERAFDQKVTFIDNAIKPEPEKEPINYSNYENRINSLKLTK